MRLHSLKLNWAHKGRRNCRRPGRVAVSDAQSAPATTTATTLLTLGQLSTWSRPHLIPYHLRLRRTTGSGQTILGVEYAAPAGACTTSRLVNAGAA